ncbi:MAG: deoxyribose-phosphate aldolase [candidate division Zixibacteria bacterium]|nr:deoxyribose-phosphate aldolase [candidate division Zixibacteria bacterium]
MDINHYIDHTNLRSDATISDIEKLCKEAVEYNFHSVCVNPIFVNQTKEILHDSGVKICSVVGFPIGASYTEIKIAEAARANAEGADEIDIVANIGWLAESNQYQVIKELAEIKRRLTSSTIVKVIIETPILSEKVWEETVRALIRARVDFVKTATGFNGPTPLSHIKTLKKYCGDDIKIKAAGGIKTRKDAEAMIEAGADRIGSSSSVQIIDPNK